MIVGDLSVGTSGAGLLVLIVIILAIVWLIRHV